MIKKVFTLLFVLCWSLSYLQAQDQFPSELWHDGKVVLLSGEELSGKIKYNLEGDLIQVLNNNLISTFSSRKIVYFEIYDETVNRYREFYALPYQVNPNYNVPRLFEVLYENTITLLCRETLVQETVPQYSYYYSSSRYYTRLKLEYEYYFLDGNGEIALYTQKKDELYDILTRDKNKLEEFIKKNNLRYDRQRDLVRITAYYNSLINT